VAGPFSVVVNKLHGTPFACAGEEIDSVSGCLGEDVDKCDPGQIFLQHLPHHVIDIVDHGDEADASAPGKIVNFAVARDVLVKLRLFPRLWDAKEN